MSDSKQYLFTANGSYFGRCLVALVFIVPVIYGIIDRGGVDLNPANVLMLPLCVALLLSFAAMTEACMMIKVNKYLFAYNVDKAITPFIPEWKFDEDVTDADEVRAIGLLEKYGKIDPVTLADTFILSQSIKDVVEQYATLEFDDYTMDYTRKDLLNGEETEECWKGFYCIGGDGGEISFYVRKSNDDERIYAFDMEGSSRPEPYASNIRRFIVMRYNAWQATLKLLDEEEKAKQRKVKGQKK